MLVRGLERVESSFVVCKWEGQLLGFVSAVAVVCIAVVLARRCKSSAALSRDILGSGMEV